MVASTLPTAASLYANVQSELRGYGNAEQERLKRSYRAAMGTAMQSLASSGLSGTTLAPSLRMGYMRQYEESLNALNQQLTQTRLGAESTFGLGGIQSEQAAKQLALSEKQIANQMTLGLGNLGVSQSYAGIAGQQLSLQRLQADRAYQLAQRQQRSTSYSTGFATPSRGVVTYPGGVGSMGNYGY
jgi:hypothetical protein